MVTFQECVLQCFDNPDFLIEFDRLAGCHLTTKKPRSAIEAMVDDATGFDDQQLDLDMQKFIAFIYEVVWLRLAPSARAPQKVSPPAGKSFAELMEDQSG